MELTRHTLVLIKAEPSRDDPLKINVSKACHWNVPNSVTESRICATIDAMCGGRDMCVNESRYAGAFRCSKCHAEFHTEDIDLVEPTLWVDGCADYPSYCPHCGRAVDWQDDK